MSGGSDEAIAAFMIPGEFANRFGPGQRICRWNENGMGRQLFLRSFDKGGNHGSPYGKGFEGGEILGAAVGGVGERKGMFVECQQFIALDEADKMHTLLQSQSGDVRADVGLVPPIHACEDEMPGPVFGFYQCGQSV